jgi:hypothetical protein
MPVNLLANVNPTLPNLARLIAAIEPALLQMAKTKQAFSDLLEQGPSDSPAARLIDALMSASNCPDLIEDRGHTFGADLSDDDKRALIEFLKTL